MNILPPVPTPAVFNVGTVNTEAVRKDNAQREAIPQLAANEKSAAETGLGSEADKVKTPGQAPAPLTYEKPVPQSGQQLDTQNDSSKDNGQDASAGKENAESQQQEQAEQKQIAELKQRDAEVRAHEQAHASVGGQYAGSPQYEYETGPDGKAYAVGGEVSIDISKEATPEETIRKAQQVKAAALAPAEPSAQDLRVAAEAAQIALEARSEIAAEKADKAQEAYQQASPELQSTEENAQGINSTKEAVNAISASDDKPIFGEVPDLNDIVTAQDISIPTRSLDSNPSQRTNPELEIHGPNQLVDNRGSEITRRVSVIEGFYQQVSSPRTEGFQQSA